MAPTSLFRTAIWASRAEQLFVFRMPPNRFLLGESVEASRGKERGHLKTLQFLLMHATVGKQELPTLDTREALVDHAMDGSLIFPVGDKALFVIVKAPFVHNASLAPCRALSRCPEEIVNGLDHVLVGILDEFKLAHI